MTQQVKQLADAVYDKDGKRLRWQCGCRQNGGVQVQAYRPPKTPDELREAFESWAKSIDYCVDRFPPGHEYAGTYVFIDVELAWWAWVKATAEAKQ
jgi:hypothetical protein